MARKSKVSEARRQQTLQRRRARRRAQRAVKRSRSPEHRAKVRKTAKEISHRILFDVLQSDAVRKEIEEHLSPGHRERTYSPAVVLAMFVRQVLNHSSLQKAISEAVVAALLPRDVSRKTASYSTARSELPTKLVKRLTMVIANELERYTPQQWNWRDRRVKLVDGSEIDLADTEANQEAFPQPTSQKKGVGFPHARIVAVISLATAAVLGIAMGPRQGKRTGEHALLRKLLSCFSRGDVMIADSYYASYFLIAVLRRMGVDFVFQQHGARKTNFRKGKHLGAGDHLATWEKPEKPEWMTDKEYARLPEELTVRELRVKKKILVTSFLDPAEVSKREVGNLFLQRWNVELDLRNIKTTLGAELLVCKKPEMCEKELAMYMLGYNLIRLIMAQAALEAGVLPRQLSFKNAVTEWLAWSQKPGALGTEEDVTAMLSAVAAVRVGNRPGRVEPRTIKRRRKAFPLLTKPREVARQEVLRNGHAKKLAA
jgi:hypothetical protein